jgi:hypothetical protein
MFCLLCDIEAYHALSSTYFQQYSRLHLNNLGNVLARRRHTRLTRILVVMTIVLGTLSEKEVKFASSQCRQ